MNKSVRLICVRVRQSLFHALWGYVHRYTHVVSSEMQRQRHATSCCGTYMISNVAREPSPLSLDFFQIKKGLRTYSTRDANTVCMPSHAANLNRATIRGTALMVGRGLIFFLKKNCACICAWWQWGGGGSGSHVPMFAQVAKFIYFFKIQDHVKGIERKEDNRCT